MEEISQPAPHPHHGGQQRSVLRKDRQSPQWGTHSAGSSEVLPHNYPSCIWWRILTNPIGLIGCLGGSKMADHGLSWGSASYTHPPRSPAKPFSRSHPATYRFPLHSLTSLQHIKDIFKHNIVWQTGMLSIKLCAGKVSHPDPSLGRTCLLSGYVC